MQFLNWLLFSFKGRLPRKHFLLFQLVQMVFTLLLLMSWAAEPLALLNREPDNAAALESLFEIVAMINLLVLWPKLAVDVKRMHDRNKPAGWVLIQFIPLIGGLWFLLEAGCLPGTPGDNRYGPPLGQAPSKSPGSEQADHSGRFDA